MGEGTTTKMGTQETHGGLQEGNTKGNKMQEKQWLKSNSKITPEASTWAPVPVATGGITHACPSQALSTVPQATRPTIPALF